MMDRPRHRIHGSFRDNSAAQFHGPISPGEADEALVGGKAKKRAFKEPRPKKPLLSLTLMGAPLALSYPQALEQACASGLQQSAQRR